MVLQRASHLDLAAIMDSGQCFRMSQVGPGVFQVAAGDRWVRVSQAGAGLFAFDCGQDQFDAFWAPYFDWNGDYGALIAQIDPADRFLARAARYGSGLRILRQDPWETLISFILSTRRNIPSIRRCVEALCARFGADMGEGLRAFPTAEALAGAPEAALRGCALGYRAPYVLETARAVASGQVDLAALGVLEDGALRRALMALPGVGPKVADCVMLFGYHRLAASPVDVWIERVIQERYGGVSPFARYGQAAGVMQQYLFFYRRALALGAVQPEAEDELCLGQAPEGAAEGLKRRRA